MRRVVFIASESTLHEQVGAKAELLRIDECYFAIRYEHK